jgi:hypothetical protein
MVDKMIKVIFTSFILAFIVLVGLNVYTQEQATRDPFQPLLPVEEKKPSIVTEEGVAAVEGVTPPYLAITGILWGTDKPRAIINGDVYGVGDSIGATGATVFKIEKNTVFVMYEGAVFKMGVEQ